MPETHKINFHGGQRRRATQGNRETPFTENNRQTIFTLVRAEKKNIGFGFRWNLTIFDF